MLYNTLKKKNFINLNFQESILWHIDGETFLYPMLLRCFLVFMLLPRLETSRGGSYVNKGFLRWRNGGGTYHSSAVIDTSALVEFGAVVHEKAILGAEVHIGSNTVIGPSVKIGPATKIG